MSAKTEFLIIGAGIIGLLTARELARAGRQVMVVERGQPGREASRAAAGILSHLPPWQSPPELLKLTNWSRAVYPALADDLHRTSGLSAGFDACGAFYLLPEEGDELSQAEHWARAQGEPFEYFSAASMKSYEPAVHAPQGAVCLPAIGRVSTSHFMRALLETVLQAGVQVLPDSKVTSLVLDNDRICGVQTGQELIHSQQTILAAGAWSADLLTPLGIQLPVKPVRGQIIQYDAPPGLLGRITLNSEGYAVPLHNGDILIGSTKERVGFDKAITDTARVSLQSQAARLLPVLADMPVARQWANLRPGSPDSLPFIGPVPGWNGLWLNTGHFTDGINTAPASARLLADRMLERSPILDGNAYAPDRLLNTRHSREGALPSREK